MSLSGGQRQRLSLARAILADAEDPGARRHAVRAGRAHRGRRRGGAAPGAARGDRHRRRAPRVDRAARRQGGAAARTAPSPTSARMPSCLPRCPQYRYLLAADDELDDGAERGCAWEDDENRSRLGHGPSRSRRPPIGPATRRPALRDVGGRRPMTATDTTRSTSPSDEHGSDWRGKFDEQPTTTCRSTRALPRAARPARCWARCCGPTVDRRACSRSSSSWKTLRAFRFRCWCSTASTTASRRSSTAGRRTP